MIPIQVEDIGSRGRAARTRAAVVGDGIQRNPQLVCARGHIEVKGVHIDGIALPRQRVAAGFHLYASDIGDGPGRAMIARNPFRINQRQRARLNWDRQLRVKNITRRVREIDR